MQHAVIVVQQVFHLSPKVCHAELSINNRLQLIYIFIKMFHELDLVLLM